MAGGYERTSPTPCAVREDPAGARRSTVCRKLGVSSPAANRKNLAISAAIGRCDVEAATDSEGPQPITLGHEIGHDAARAIGPRGDAAKFLMP
jgi:hypothetical protein